jgi:leucyl aminopeptidase
MPHEVKAMPLPSLVDAGFDPAPSTRRIANVSIPMAVTIPETASAVGVPVPKQGRVPSLLGVDRKSLGTAGFDGSLGQSLVVPRSGGPTLVAVGIGDPAELDSAAVRDIAAAFARASERHRRVAITLEGLTDVPAEAAAMAIVEGVLLARYRYDQLRRTPATVLDALTIVAPARLHDELGAGIVRGRITATAAALARDLANGPPAHLTARRIADVAARIAASSGLEAEVFDREALIAMGCGGILGVNAGSDEPPFVVRLRYRPDPSVGRSLGHLALVGKGVTYDAGGISLKPSDAMHAAMKLDMSGAAAILGAMSTLRDLDCRATVTGYLMLTDNMPSGTALRLGDVLTIRGGTTVEVVNADAEGRLILADGIVLSTEDRADAIVTIATLTGAAMRALGTAMAALLGNNVGLLDQVESAASATDERVWQLPLERRYRSKMDSAIADIKNLGGENAGAITAALFLEEFVAGVPFAHLDICGPMMVERDELWRSTGATAFGTRLLIELALRFRKPRP